MGGGWGWASYLQPGVLQGLVNAHPATGIHHQQLPHDVFSWNTEQREPAAVAAGRRRPYPGRTRGSTWTAPW